MTTLNSLALILIQNGIETPSADDSSMLMIWGTVLILAAFALFVVEIFVPSGGMIGFTALVCLIGGIILLAKVNTTLGIITAIASLIALPFLAAFAIKIFPDTPIGRMLTLKSPGEDRAAEGDEANNESGNNHLPFKVGDTGKAITDLRPVGTCLINGKREECLATAGMIEAGTEIAITDIDGNQIKVKSSE